MLGRVVTTVTGVTPVCHRGRAFPRVNRGLPQSVLGSSAGRLLGLFLAYCVGGSRCAEVKFQHGVRAVDFRHRHPLARNHPL